MLQCLNRPHRAAYVLGETMELAGPEVADMLAISPALFRKRVQPAREVVLAFTNSH
jgi:DNA-directed RNA polymerase specialized sigma24 family protein